MDTSAVSVFAGVAEWPMNWPVNVPSPAGCRSIYGKAAQTRRCRRDPRAHAAALCFARRAYHAGIAYEQTLKDNHVSYELDMYEGVNHAFHNDIRPHAVHEAAANQTGSEPLTAGKNLPLV